MINTKNMQYFQTEWFNLLTKDLDPASYILAFSTTNNPIGESAYLTAQRMHIVGVHLDKALRNYMSLKSKNIHFDHSVKGLKLNTLNFPLDFFDRVVFLNEVFEQVPYQANRAYLLNYCYKLLKPDGILVLTCNKEEPFLEQAPSDSIIKLEDDHEFLVPLNPTGTSEEEKIEIEKEMQFHHFFTQEMLKEELEQVGFIVNFQDAFESHNILAACCYKK